MLLEQLLLQRQNLPDGLGETSKESGPGDTSSLHSREDDEKNSQKETDP